jgi:hypothetical protein
VLGELERRRGGNIPCEECSGIRGHIVNWVIARPVVCKPESWPLL